MDRLLYRGGVPRIICEPSFRVEKALRPWETPHLFVQWAKAVSYGTDTPRFHTAVVNSCPDLPSKVTEAKRREPIDYAKSQEWLQMEPELRAVVLNLSDASTNSRREVIGLAKFVNSVLNRGRLVNEVLTHLEVDLEPMAFVSRLEFAQDFGDSEDWLTALSQIIWVDGRQLEAEAKETAKATNLEHLAGLKDISIGDLEGIYEKTVRTIRPTATYVTIFRGYYNPRLDDLLPGMPSGYTDIFQYWPNKSPADRRKAVERFLSKYNRILHNPGHNTYDQTWIYGTYTTVHPHTDYNGTMTRTLVDYYRQTNGLPPIDWLDIKRNQDKGREIEDARRLYEIMGESEPLEKVFRQIA